MKQSKKIISLTSKRTLKTKVFDKKASLLVKEMYRPIFSRVIEYDKAQGTTDKFLQGIATIIV